MIVYHLKYAMEGHYFGTLAEAKDSGRLYSSMMLDNQITQYDVPTDKASILMLLNGDLVPADGEPQRRWEFTERGGLIEVNEEGYRI